MKTYEFVIVATGLSLDDDGLVDRFYDAGCDDAVVSIRGGEFVLYFDRAADSLEQAITSAASDVAQAGANVSRVEYDI